MKRGSTLFLKFVIILIGAAVLAFCVLVLPDGILSAKTSWMGYKPILIGMYIPAIPFFIGLYQAFRLLNNIDKNKIFSKASIRSLQIIKYCGIAISLVYGLSLPYIFYVAQLDDAPGVVLIGLVFTFAPMLAAVIAAVLQKIFSNAIDIKSENDLII